MSVEGPLSVAVISRLPQPEISNAAFLMMMGLAMWIESPVIDLLSTSTTLARSRQNYAQLSRYVWILIGIVTAVHAAVVFTPLYWLVSEHILGVDMKVAQTARFGLAIMLPWSGFIGWRRYLQGILIRYGRTTPVGLGTAVRMSTIAIVISILYLTTHLMGIQIAACALSSAVFAEAMYIHWASRSVIREHFSGEVDAPAVELRKLSSFHLPLAATTLVMLSSAPIVTAALSRMPNSIEQQAAYQVASTLIWLMRTTVYALPETVIALYSSARESMLRGFCLRLGLLASSIMLVLYLLRLDVWFFTTVLGERSGLAALAHQAFLAAVLLPLIGALQSYLRGTLTAHHLTVSRLTAVLVNTLTFCVGLGVGVATQGNGVVIAGVAITAAMLAELAVLAWSWRLGQKKMASAAAKAN